MNKKHLGSFLEALFTKKIKKISFSERIFNPMKDILEQAHGEKDVPQINMC